MRELDCQETEQVSGGNPIVVGLMIYEIASIGWDFYQGYRDGYNETMAR